MKIIINQIIANNINELIDDPSIENARKYLQNNDLYIKSAIELSIFNTAFGSISILYGPRQIGKTASLKLFLSQVTDSDTLIYTDCSVILDKADLRKHLSELISGKTTVVLDEVQSVADWHLALRALYSEGALKNCRVWCTGSEARYLLESGERLPGRKGLGKTVFARPWSFRETMDFFHPEAAASFRNINYKHVNQLWLDSQNVEWGEHWRRYCQTGGVPLAVAEFEANGRISDRTWGVYVDWILGTWSRLRTPQRSLVAVARRLCETLNSRVSFEAIKKGTDIQSPNTIRTLLEMQEDHFALKMLPRFDLQNEKFLPSKLKKIYPLDPFVARIWSAIGANVRRLYCDSLPELPLDECAFFAQMYRSIEEKEVSYLYSEASKSEIDFFFDGCAFELKSNGNPTKKQLDMLKKAPQAFVVRKDKLPLMAYLIGEGRNEHR